MWLGQPLFLTLNRLFWCRLKRQIYSDKLAHIQVIINCRYFMAQSCTSEGGLAYISGALSIDDVMSSNLLTPLCILCLIPTVQYKSYSDVSIIHLSDIQVLAVLRIIFFFFSVSLRARRTLAGNPHPWWHQKGKQPWGLIRLIIHVMDGMDRTASA